jgi:hypothetical protein
MQTQGKPRKNKGTVSFITSQEGKHDGDGERLPIDERAEVLRVAAIFRR